MNKDTEPSAGGNAEIDLGILNQIVGYRFRRIQNQLTRRFSAATERFGLRAGTYTSLAIIAHNPGISQSELARAISIDKTMVMQIIDEIEAKGLGTRVRVKSDRRRHALYLTREGEQLLREMTAAAVEAEEQLLARLSAEDRLTLTGLLDRMLKTLD